MPAMRAMDDTARSGHLAFMGVRREHPLPQGGIVADHPSVVPVARFTGLFTVTPGAERVVNVQVQLDGTDRSRLDLTMTVLGPGCSGGPIDFHGNYAVLHGTGRLAHAVGRGTVTGIVTASTLPLTFDLQGAIVP
jgi:hypothetical protein